MLVRKYNLAATAVEGAAETEKRHWLAGAVGTNERYKRKTAGMRDNMQMWQCELGINTGHKKRAIQLVNT